MSNVREHYRTLLAPLYAWMCGGAEAAIGRQRELLRELGIDREPRGLAIDLGAGFGAQSIALAEFGHAVIAVDFDPSLLDELARRACGLNVRCECAELVEWLETTHLRANLAVSMGDTLTHLATFDELRRALHAAARVVLPGGAFVIGMRDYVGGELAGAARFIPVRSDEHTIFTCFLEYARDHVDVHDLVHRQLGEQWKLEVGVYRKLRIARERLLAELAAAGFAIERDASRDGSISVVARRI